MTKVKNKKTIKRGRLSAEEKGQIEKLCETKSDEEIAKLLRRPVESVQLYRVSFLTSNPGLASRKNEHVQIRESLHAHYKWESFKKEFDSDELIQFEHSYVEWVSQFDSNVMSSERNQIFQAITLELFMARHNRERRQSQSDMDRLERMIDIQFGEKSPEEMSPAERQQMMDWQGQLSALRQTTQSKTKEYKDLSDRYSGITKELKGLRQQRIDRVDNKDRNFIGVLKMLEEEDLRNRIGADMVIMDHAVEAELKRLSEFHKYMDGEIDFPLNTPEVVLAAEEVGEDD